MLWGMLSPNRTSSGVMLAALAMVAVVVFAIARTTVPDGDGRKACPPPTCRQLAGRAEVWLEQQQPLLPALAQAAARSIGTRLDQLGLQLDTLDPASPVATEVRSLVGEHLPALVRSYEKVPPPHCAHGSPPAPPRISSWPMASRPSTARSTT